MIPRQNPIRSAYALLVLSSVIVFALTLLMPAEAGAQVRRERTGQQAEASTQTGTVQQPGTLVGSKAVESLKQSGSFESLSQAVSTATGRKFDGGNSDNLFNGGQYEQITLTAADGQPYDYSGFSVAISGNTAVVGSGFFGKTYTEGVAQGIGQEAVYVFVRSGNTWTQQAKLVASDVTSYSAFGMSLAISGDTIAVGAPYDDIDGSYAQGSVYIFTRSGDTWTEQTKLVASDGMPYDDFGYKVSLDGDTLVIGAPYDDEDISCIAYKDGVCLGGSGNDFGSAYVFVRSGTVWAEQQKLVAADGAEYDNFGFDVAVSGDTVAVGCMDCSVGSNVEQGAGYIFVRSGTVWNQEAKLSAADGAPYEYFGFSVDVEGDTAIFGSVCNGSTQCSGAAYVFNRAEGTWSQTEKLTPAVPEYDGYYGFTVAISGNTLVVGNPGDSLGGAGYGNGSVDVYKFSGTNWNRQKKLYSSDPGELEYFGFSADVSGDTVIAGVPQDDIILSPEVSPSGGIGSNMEQGSARIFQTAIDISKQTPADGSASDWFGRSVAISGDTAVVGAPLDDINSNVNQGSAYIFVRVGSSWIEQAKLTSSDGAAGDNFGWSVAIDGNTVVVGAPLDDIETNADQGSAYVFTRSIGVWTQEQKLTSPSAYSAYGFAAANNNFGWSVSVSGDRTLVGEPLLDYPSAVDSGGMTLFKRASGAWSFEQTIVGGPPGMLAGWSVGISGDKVVVGTPGNNGGDGAAFFGLITSGGWGFNSLNQLDGGAGDNYGWSVAISGDTMVVGAPLHDLGVPLCPGASAVCATSSIAPEAATPVNQGAAYVFTYSGTGLTFSLGQKVTASDNANNDQFGYTVSISGNNLLVGAYGDDVSVNADQGSSYMFTRSGGFFTEQRKLTDEYGAPGDGFGWSVGVSTNTAVVGAWADDDNAPTVGYGPNQGSASYYYWAQAAPTAAEVKLSGKVVTPDGRGLAGATVTVTDSKGNDRVVQTGTFGNFSFTDIPSGETLVVTVRSKGYQFSPQAIDMLSDMDGLKIVASGGKR